MCRPWQDVLSGSAGSMLRLLYRSSGQLACGVALVLALAGTYCARQRSLAAVASPPPAQ
jgi:hypothetical protein